MVEEDAGEEGLGEDGWLKWMQVRRVQVRKGQGVVLLICLLWRLLAISIIGSSCCNYLPSPLLLCTFPQPASCERSPVCV